MMNRIFENKLFPEIEEFFASKGFTVLYEDIEGKNVLIMEPDSDVLFEDCNITVDSFDEESTAVNILFTLESKLPDEFSDNVDDLLLYLNKYLTIGCFELIKENGFFFFRCSYLADTQAPIVQVMKVFLMTWQIASDTAVQGSQIVRSLIQGEAEIGELLSDDSSIIQFD